MALLFIQLFGINGIWWSITLSSLLKGVVAYLYYKLKVQKQYRCDEGDKKVFKGYNAQKG